MDLTGSVINAFNKNAVRQTALSKSVSRDSVPIISSNALVLFAGGISSTEANRKVVDYFDDKLVRRTATPMTKTGGGSNAAVSYVNDYFLIAGGGQTSTVREQEVEVYQEY